MVGWRGREEDFVGRWTTFIEWSLNNAPGAESFTSQGKHAVEEWNSYDNVSLCSSLALLPNSSGGPTET